jgi:hypothetical protein
MTVALALAAGTLLLASPASAVVMGIGDQKTAFFGDARFQALKIRHARLIVPWDAMKYPWQVERLDAWLGAAQRAHVIPLVVFGRSITDQYRDMLPTVDDFAETVAAFRARYPWIREFATWNEPNHCSQPTCRDPARVAAFYNLLRARCSDCRVLGAAILGVGGLGKWMRRFLAAAHPRPRYWGFHNYLDVNSFNRVSTRAFLRLVTGEVWLTETAGIVSWHPGRELPFRTSTSHAALAMHWLFDWMLPVSRRIARVYLYEWTAVANARWDSGLVGPTGKSRPALSVVRHYLRSGVRRPRRDEKQARRRWLKKHAGH